MSRLIVWASAVFTGIVTLALVATAAVKISHMPKEMMDGIIRAGIPESAVVSKESVFPLILLGLFVWGGICFRVPALQSLLPLRREQEMVVTDATDRPEVRGRRRAAVS